MMSNNKSSFSMYEELLAHQAEDENSRITGPTLPPVLSKYFDSDVDSEEFVTSQEIAKTKEVIEKKTGLTSDDDGVIEESVHFQRFTQRRQHKYTEKEMGEIRNSCHRTIVHDYGEFDIYHISNEERARNDQLASISLRLGKLKRMYRRVDQYIEAMRTVFEAWSILEKVNYLHTRDEFFKMVADGKIVSSRIIMPKLKKMDQYNIDMIIAYISNPELDASHLVPKKAESSLEDDWLSDESEDEEMKRLLSKEEVEYIINGMENPQKMEIGYIKPKYIKGYDRRGRGKKKCDKKERAIRASISEILNKIQNGNSYKGYTNSYMVTNSLFEPEKKEKNMWDDLQFNGSWGNKNDVALYELVVAEEMLKEQPVRGRHLTYADKELQNFFTVLEDNGVSAIELRRKINVVDESRRREKVTKKENKKLESALIQRITKLNNSSKFKKIVEKAEDALSKYRDGEV